MNNVFVFFVGLLFFSSCAPIYIPNAPLVFNSEEQGDAMLEVKQGFYSTNIQGGYAATDFLNIGISLSSLYSYDHDVLGVATKGTRAKEVNMVLGYYRPLSDRSILELNVGGGPIFEESPERISNYYKAYFQPSITLVSGRFSQTRLTFLTRLVYSSYVNDYFGNTGLPTKMNRQFLEPVLDLSLGKELMFTTQAGLSIEAYRDEIDRDGSPFIFNLGVKFLLNRKEATLP